MNDQIGGIDEQKLTKVTKSVDQEGCIKDKPGDETRTREGSPLDITEFRP